MAGRKLLKASQEGQFQLFPEAMERDPLQLSLVPEERARAQAAEAARKVRALMAAQPADLFPSRK
jgi:hypothetical protein